VSDIKAILFDLDGTLVDTAPDFVIAGNALRQDYKLPPLDPTQIAMHVSNGAAAVTQRCMEIGQDHPEFEIMRDQLLERYEQCLGKQSAVYPALLPYLLNLTDATWGVVTNKPVRYAEPLIQQLNIYEQCAVLVCPDHVTHKKPDPEGLHLAAQQLSLANEQIVYVGDHRRDIDAGKAAGMPTVAVGYGYLLEDDNPEMWGADYYAHTDADLTRTLKSLIY